jgi:nitroreductase
MNVGKAIQRRRSIRKYQQKPIPEIVIESMIEAARLAPSAANLQPCEFVVVDDDAVAEKLFPYLKWASHIAPDGTPPDGSHPTAYIVVLVNRKIAPKGGERDVGAAVQNILLTATEQGLGSCWIASIDTQAVSALLRIPDHCHVDSVIALGYSAESPVIEIARDNTKYWKDTRGVLHVPKRRIETIYHWNRYKEKGGKSK